MTRALTQPPAGTRDLDSIPPLENGDRLNRIEFERRYAAMKEVNKAQLIEGVVFMPSPVTHLHHGSPHFDLITWLGLFRISTPGIRGGDNSSLRLDLPNEPQPDAYLIILPSHGGQAHIDVEGYLVGAPELIAEVSATTVSLDLNGKLTAYQRNGVREYIVWRVLDRAVDWFVLADGRFDPLPMIGGYYHSKIFPGLRLDPDALINGDMVRVSQVLQQGLATPEHAAFVTQLQQAAAGLPQS